MNEESISHASHGNEFGRPEAQAQGRGRADELGQRFTNHLDKIKDQVQLKGFRKGKVPLTHIKKVFGRSVMGDVLQETIRETSSQGHRRPQGAPRHDAGHRARRERRRDRERDVGQADLSYVMSFDVLPEVKLTDFKALKLERLVADVDAERSTRPSPISPSAIRRSPPRRAARPATATASRSISSARSMGDLSSAARARA